MAERYILCLCIFLQLKNKTKRKFVHRDLRTKTTWKAPAPDHRKPLCPGGPCVDLARMASCSRALSRMSEFGATLLTWKETSQLPVGKLKTLVAGRTALRAWKSGQQEVGEDPNVPWPLGEGGSHPARTPR